jgi:hypothetical protein
LMCCVFSQLFIRRMHLGLLQKNQRAAAAR